MMLVLLKNNVSLLYAMLEKMCCGVDKKHELWYEEAVEIMKYTETVPVNSRPVWRSILTMSL